MAQKRPAGFNIPLGFYDGPEVKSIPRRIRAAAVGVWALCGTFSANKLQDGYVGAETLRELCCTDAIRDALQSTRGADGESDPLWTPARDGGIQFTKWVKYQRSRDEVKAYRSADADRKREERKAAKDAATSDDPKTSDRTLAGHPPDSGDPSTKTKTKTENNSGSVGSDLTVSRAAAAEPESVSATPGAELVRAIVPGETPAAVQTALRIRASELIKAGHPRADVAAALELWLTKPHLGANALPTLLSEVQRSRTTQRHNGIGKPTQKALGWERAGAELLAEMENPQ